MLWNRIQDAMESVEMKDGMNSDFDCDKKDKLKHKDCSIFVKKRKQSPFAMKLSNSKSFRRRVTLSMTVVKTEGRQKEGRRHSCLLYTSDAADD